MSSKIAQCADRLGSLGSKLNDNKMDFFLADILYINTNITYYNLNSV
jgi:hypothetical protein